MKICLAMPAQQIDKERVLSFAKRAARFDTMEAGNYILPFTLKAVLKPRGSLSLGSPLPGSWHNYFEVH
ncbi:MAG: hypothetical protein ABF297_06830 [Thiogranum sp.]